MCAKAKPPPPTGFGAFLCSIQIMSNDRCYEPPAVSMLNGPLQSTSPPDGYGFNGYTTTGIGLLISFVMNPDQTLGQLDIDVVPPCAIGFHCTSGPFLLQFFGDSQFDQLVEMTCTTPQWLEQIHIYGIRNVPQ